MAADAAANSDLEQGKTGETAAVILVGDLLHDGRGKALDGFLLSGILGS